MHNEHELWPSKKIKWTHTHKWETKQNLWNKLEFIINLRTRTGPYMNAHKLSMQQDILLYNFNALLSQQFSNNYFTLACTLSIIQTLLYRSFHLHSNFVVTTNINFSFLLFNILVSMYYYHALNLTSKIFNRGTFACTLLINMHVK